MIFRKAFPKLFLVLGAILILGALLVLFPAKHDPDRARASVARGDLPFTCVDNFTLAPCKNRVTAFYIKNYHATRSSGERYFIPGEIVPEQSNECSMGLYRQAQSEFDQKLSLYDAKHTILIVATERMEDCLATPSWLKEFRIAGVGTEGVLFVVSCSVPGSVPTPHCLAHFYWPDLYFAFGPFPVASLGSVVENAPKVMDFAMGHEFQNNRTIVVRPDAQALINQYMKAVDGSEGI